MTEPRTKLRSQGLAAVTSLMVLLAGGTIVYHRIEGWTWIQSFYFCVVSLMTVGYGDLTPTSDGSRLFTAFYLLTGATIVIAAAAVLGAGYLERRGARIDERRQKRSQAKNEEKNNHQ